MEKVRLIYLGITLSIVLNSGGGILNVVKNATLEAYAEEESSEVEEGVSSEDEQAEKEKEEENEKAEETEGGDEEEEIMEGIFIKAFNPGFSGIGEFFEIGARFKGDSFSLAGFSIIYTTASGKDYVVYEFSEEEETVGESLLFRLKSSEEVKAVEEYREVADAIYTRNMAQGGGRIRILKLVEEGEVEEENKYEVVDSLCWGLEEENGETCYAKFNSKTPTTLVRDDEAEEMEELFKHTENYTPSYDPENPSLIEVKQEEAEEIIEPKCRTIRFNEILTYFETSENEQFIEVYNEGEIAVNLNGCLLRYKNKNYELSGTVSAGGLGVIYPNAEFELRLTKNPTNENTLEIIDADGKVVDKLVYYSGQKKGVALAQFGYNSDGSEQWLQTYSPTPGEENNYQKFKTCPAGKVINEETGNCVNETKISTELAACPEGKYRNPLTNRCKSYATTASAELKPCAEGYERNPATGRCRKIVNNEGAEYPLVAETFEEKSKFIATYAIIGVVALGVLYIVFQYREEIKGLFKKH